MKFKDCRGVGCSFPATKEGWCGPHFNDHMLAQEAIRKRDKRSAAELRAADEFEKQNLIDTVEKMVDLEWWFEVYGEQAHPAAFMDRFYGCLERPRDHPALTPEEHNLLEKALKVRNGYPVNGGSHRWSCLDGGLYACVPIAKHGAPQ